MSEVVPFDPDSLFAQQSGVNLEDQLLDHLATAEGAMAIYRDRLDPALLGDEDDLARSVLVFTYEFISKYHKAPGEAVLRSEFGCEFMPPEQPVGYVLEKLRERYRRTEMQQVVGKVAKLTTAEPDEAVRYAFNEFARIQSLSTSRASTRDTHDLSERLDDYNKRVLEGAFKGVTFGWEIVDDDLGGLRKNTLAVVIARLKRGKSWFLLKSAHEAWKQGEDVDLYTLELAVKDMQDRHLCMLAGVNYGRFWKGKLEREENERFKWAEEYAKEQENKIRFIRPSPGDRTVPQMLQTSIERHDVGAMYIDQLSWIDPTKSFKDARWREVEFIMAELKAASDHIPVYIAAQFNREAAGLNEMGDAAQIGLSDSIGQTADLLLGIYASKDMRDNGITEFGVIEARNCPVTRYEMKFRLDGEEYLPFLNRKEQD